MNHNFKLKGNTFTKIFTVMLVIDVVVPNVAVTAIIGVLLLYELLTYLAVKAARELKFGTVSAKKKACKGEKALVRLKAEGPSQTVMFASCHADLNVANLLTGENSDTSADFLLTRRGGTGYKINVTETRCGVIHVTLKNARIQDAFGKKKEYVLAGSQAEILYQPDIRPVELPARFFASGSAGVYLFARGDEFQGAFLGDAQENVQEGAGGTAAAAFSAGGTGTPAGENRARSWVVKAFEPVAFSALANQPVTGSVGVLFLNYVQTGHTMTPERKSRLAELALSVADTLVDAGLAHEFLWLGRSADGSAECRRAAHRQKEDVLQTAETLMRTGYTDENGAEILKNAVAPGEFQTFLLITAGGDQEGALFGELGSVRMLKV